MVRPRSWIPVLLGAVWVAAVGASSGAAEAPGAEPPVAATGQPASGVSGVERIWIEPGMDRPGHHNRFHVRYAEVHDVGQPILFECEIQSEETSESVTARLEIRSGESLRQPIERSNRYPSVTVGGGERRRSWFVPDRRAKTAPTELYRASIALPLEKGVNECRFSWTPAGLADGAYTATFTLLAHTGNRELCGHELRLTKLSSDRVAAEVEAAAQETAAVNDHLRTIEALGEMPAYSRMRTAVAEDAIEPARRAFAEGNWLRANALAAYIRDVVRSARSALDLGGLIPELVEPAPNTDLSTIEARDGAFRAKGRPVFLFGSPFGRPKDWPPAQGIARLRRYGLNFAVVRMGPSVSLATETERAKFEPEFDSLFECAQSNNLGLVIDLAPGDMPEWVFERWPDLLQTSFGDNRFDITGPEARALIERHIAAVVPYLARQKMLAGLSLVDRPQFHFEGEEVRKGFIAYVQGAYKDRDAINRAWRARMRKLDEIDVWWDYASSAYQYDWQSFQLQLGCEFLEWMKSLARPLAPDLPLFVAPADDVFNKGESSFGVDRETLAGVFDVSGCQAANGAQSQFLAMGFPQECMYYTLLRSLAPDRPICNTGDRFLSGNDRHTPYSFGYVHSLMWLNAMSGLSASAAPIEATQDALSGPGETLAAHPEALEAYATACLDLNRLADVVVGFQNAPADVAILWSMASKILGGGDAYLASVGEAFQGVSFFGYKVRFITERQCAAGQFAGVKVLVIPEALAVPDECFRALANYVGRGGVIIRFGNPFPYGIRGEGRQDMLAYTNHTVLLRGHDTATSYLHAMDAAYEMNSLAPIPRPINDYGYPVEGVLTRYLAPVDTGALNNEEHLFVLNLRKTAVNVFLFGGPRSGRDLIHGSGVEFPCELATLVPMLVRLDPKPALPKATRKAEASTPPPKKSLEAQPKGEVPTAEVKPVPPRKSRFRRTPAK